MKRAVKASCVLALLHLYGSIVTLRVKGLPRIDFSGKQVTAGITT